MSIRYSVEVEGFAERHFIKNFKKKYKNAWEITWRAVIEEFKRIDSLLETSIAETIIVSSNIKIVKTQFRVAGTNQSKKTSGNRCIIAVHQDKNTVYVLLVYHKNNLGSGSETAFKLPHPNSFFCDYDSGEIKLSDEIADYKWVSVEELKNYPLISGIREEIEIVDRRIKKRAQSSWSGKYNKKGEQSMLKEA